MFEFKKVNFDISFINDDFYRYLKYNDFFVAPASTKYHGNYQGGLLKHSINVATILNNLTINNKLKWMDNRSPTLIGLFHDLCKIDNYIKTDNGYIHNKDITLNGHGDKSIMILSQFIKLTVEEIHCIRWHMGAFDNKDNWNSYSSSIKKYPNVLWTHHADMISATIDNI